MKRAVLTVLFFCAALGVFAQKISVVAVAPFEAGGGAAPADAASLTRQVIDELDSWGTLTILPETSADAEYIVRGRLTRQGGMLVLSAVTVDARSGKTLNESTEQAAALSDISVFSFCTKVTENVPYPNYLLGKWQASINMPDGPIVCIMEFAAGRTVNVEQYDSWEHRQNNALKYEGYGSGSYSYAGYARRKMSVKDGQGNSREITVDATLSVNLKLEETLPEQSAVNQSGLRLLFNDEKSAFEFVSGALLCGRNYDGTSVYPFSTVAFTRFSKIR